MLLLKGLVSSYSFIADTVLFVSNAVFESLTDFY